MAIHLNIKFKYIAMRIFQKLAIRGVPVWRCGLEWVKSPSGNGCETIRLNKRNGGIIFIYFNMN